MGFVAQLRAVASPAPALRPALLAVSSGAALLALASANGGYFPTSWGWASLVFAWTALVAVLVGEKIELSAEAAVLLGALMLLAGWTFLSSAWSWDVPATVLEGERTLVYVTGVAALLLVVRARDVPALLGGILAAITLVSLYALATRLFPARVGRFDSTAGYRLFTPVGYWNALGLFAAIGALLAIGFVARGRSVGGRAAAAAALVLLLPTIYFTFSRGSWLALAIALAVVIAFDPRRLQTCVVVLVAGAAPAAAVYLSRRSPALTTIGTPLASAEHAGHRLAVEIVVLMAVAAALAVVLAASERRVVPGRSTRVAFGAVLVATVLIGIGAVWAHWGSPPSLARRAWHGFTSAPPATGANLNKRLFHLSGSGRIDLWRSSMHEFRRSPVGGTGAGTFETWWQQHRSQSQQVLDAHSLYLETLAELGVVGLAILAAMLAAPLVAAWRARRSPLVPFAAGGFAAWIVHAAVDWDWEVSAVTLAALACAVACVAREGVAPRRLVRTLRPAVVSLAAAIAAFSIVSAIGNHALSSANGALGNSNYASAQSEARRAASWAPWAGDPWVLLGQIDALTGDRSGARRSFERALAREPRNYLAWYGLAGVASGAARDHAAEQVVLLNPLSDEAAEMRRLLAGRP